MHFMRARGCPEGIPVSLQRAHRRIHDAGPVVDEQQSLVIRQTGPQHQSFEMAPETLAPFRARQYDRLRGTMPDYAPFSHYGITNT